MRKWLLVGILVLGVALRLLAINIYPVGFTPDEASFGYDAYSILKTGKDQWGNSFPLVSKSFGDYKAPLYAYLTIPSVALFGLTKEAVRLPNAIFGILALLATYLLASKLFNNKVGVIAAFLLAVSPWHIPLSRGAFEANLTTFFLPLGAWLFLEKRYTLAGVVLGLNLFTYHAAKLVTPIVFIALLFYSRENVKRFWPAFVTFGLFLILGIYTIFLGAATRALDINIFSGSLEEASSARIAADNSGLNPVLAKLVFNKYEVDAKRFFSNYFSYFSPQFLFTNGAAESTYGMTPGRGVLYWFELPLLIAFLVTLYSAKEKRGYFLILIWILTAPIPAALATGPGYAANRAVVMLPALQVLLALGFIEIPWQKFRILSYGYGAISLILIILFLTNYFFVFPSKNAEAMLYGNYEAARWLSENVKSAKTIVVDRSLSEPQIYIAFANKWDPSDYQKWTHNWELGQQIKWVDQIPQYQLGNYVFKTVHPQEYLKQEDIYMVSKKDAFLPTTEFLKVFSYPNGDPAVEIMKI